MFYMYEVVFLQLRDAEAQSNVYNNEQRWVVLDLSCLVLEPMHSTIM